MPSPQCVLIVDDSLLARMMLRKFVGRVCPFSEICEGKDGNDALAKVEGKSVDVALVDYNMPGMNGLDLAKALLRRFPTVKIALITANIQDYIAKEAEDMGIEFINKPIEIEKIASFFRASE